MFEIEKNTQLEKPPNHLKDDDIVRLIDEDTGHVSTMTVKNYKKLRKSMMRCLG